MKQEKSNHDIAIEIAGFSHRNSGVYERVLSALIEKDTHSARLEAENLRLREALEKIRQMTIGKPAFDIASEAISGLKEGE